MECYVGVFIETVLQAVKFYTVVNWEKKSFLKNFEKIKFVLKIIFLSIHYSVKFNCL